MQSADKMDITTFRGKHKACIHHLHNRHYLHPVTTKTDRDTSPIAPPCHETNHTKKYHINHSTPYIDEALQTSLQKHQTLRCAFGLGLRANTCSSHTKSARCNCPAQPHWWRRHSRPLCHHCRREHQQQRQGGLCHYKPRWQTLHQGQQHFGGDNGY